MIPLSAVKPKDMAISAKIPHAAIFPRPNSRFTNPVKIPSLASLFFCKTITIERISTKEPVLAASSSSSLQSVDDLPPKLQEIIDLFRGVQDPKAKYEQLLFYGRNLNPLDSQHKTTENKVQGCVSQVWVRAYLDGDKKVVFEADSDSVLTKGLAALLVRGLSGRPLEEIVRVSPDFVVLLGLQQSLTPSRNNGFLNMLKLMQKKALQLYLEAKPADSLRAEKIPSEDSDRLPNGEAGEVKLSEPTPRNQEEKLVPERGLGSRGLRIKEKLERELRPVRMEIDDISYQHAHHSGVKGSHGETHFNLKVISDEFEGKSMIKRHRLIYSLLQEELENGLHALSIEAKTPAEVGA